jgi:hypothetical protein
MLSMREADCPDTLAGRGESERREAAIELYIEHRRHLAAQPGTT